MKLEFLPTLRKLEKNVDVLPQLVSAISEFKRLPEIISRKKSQENPIHTSIGLCLDLRTLPFYPAQFWQLLTTDEGRNLGGRSPLSSCLTLVG